MTVDEHGRRMRGQELGQLVVWEARGAVDDAVHAVVRACHGSISAEHGIGRMKRDELIATAPPVAIELMRRIKAAFDPAGIMNPNKMI